MGPIFYNADPPLIESRACKNIYTGHKKGSKGARIALFRYLFSKTRAKVQIKQESGADPGFGQGGPPASEAESCRRSEAESREPSEHSVARIQGLLKGPGSFWVFDAPICIFTHPRYSFSLILDIYFDTKS